MAQAEVRNKWTGRVYTVRRIDACKVTLVRQDGSAFTISVHEYEFNYRPCLKADKREA